jgi:histidine ammonia-lyase
VLDASTSPPPASAATRAAAMCTAMPATSSSFSAISPVCSSLLTAMPSGATPRRIDDVGEQHRRQDPVGLHFAARAGQKLLDLGDDPFAVAAMEILCRFRPIRRAAARTAPDPARRIDG